MVNPQVKLASPIDGPASSGLDTADDENRRSAPRRRVLKGCIVAYNNRHCTIECMLRDISASGARLQVTGSLDIPDTFELIVEVDGVEAECEVVWRYGRDVGVRFISQLKQSTRKRDQIISAVVPDKAPSLRRSRIGRLDGDEEEASKLTSELKNDNQTLPVPESNQHVEDAPAEETEPVQTAAKQIKTVGDSGSNRLLALLITLHPEVSRAGVLTAISSCIANAIVSGGQPVALRNLIRYFPRESAKLTLASQRINRWYEASELNLLLKGYNSRLSHAKEFTIKVMEDGLVWGQPAPSDLLELATRWKAACSSSKDFLLELGEQFSTYGVDGVVSELSLLIRLLESAAHDGYQLISADGEVIMPDWFEFRNHERAFVRCPAELYVNGECHNILVRDFTSVGVGIECSVDLISETAVELRIGHSLQLLGNVIWCRDGRAGIQFVQPFYGLDPRMVFCGKEYPKVEPFPSKHS